VAERSQQYRAAVLGGGLSGVEGGLWGVNSVSSRICVLGSSRNCVVVVLFRCPERPLKQIG